MNVRKAIIDAGFRRDPVDEPEAYDSGNGVYTETFVSLRDATVIKLRWDKKAIEPESVLATNIQERIYKELGIIVSDPILSEIEGDVRELINLKKEATKLRSTLGLPPQESGS